MQKLNSMLTNTYLRVVAVVCLSITTLAGSAVELIDDGIEITRSATDLGTVLRQRPADSSVLDTALILTNQSRTVGKVRCVAYNQAGRIAGRAWVRLPGNGMRIMLASDITLGSSFVGSVRCKARGRVAGSAFIIGAAFSDAQVHNAIAWDQSRISAPVVVAY